MRRVAPAFPRISACHPAISALGGVGARRNSAGGLALSLLLLATACGTPVEDEPSAIPAGGAEQTGDRVTAINPLGRPRCRPPVGTSGAPRTIGEAVTLLNALPKPTTVACFVESLDRPLSIFATSSPFSAQPAYSQKSPRVFIKTGGLWLSIVIDGDSSYLVEFGEIIPDATDQSLKGELKLPLEDTIALSAPFDRVRYGAGSVCGLCHTNEEQDPSIGFTSAFKSTAFRPRAESYVSVTALREHDRQCDWQAEPHRCELLSAVFQGGAVMEAPFPNTMATFF